MRARLVGRAALVLLVVSAGLAGCKFGEQGSAGAPVLSDAEALNQFVAAEQGLDRDQVARALKAGGDLADAAGQIELEWERARVRLLASLGSEGVVPSGGGPGTARALDFASLAWSTWSLGLLYLGNDAAGTVEHGPSDARGVTTSESTTVTAAKQGPIARVDLSTTRTQSSPAGWSVTQTATVALELPLCPDPDGVIAFDIDLALETRGSSGTGATSSISDVLAGHVTAIVDDDAELASLEVTGGYDHTTSAQGEGLTVPAGDSGIRVEVGPDSVSAESTAGEETQAALDEARNYGAVLLRLTGGLAAARAGDFYEKGYCTEIRVEPAASPVTVGLGSETALDVVVAHTWDGVELTDRVTTVLSGGESVTPTGRTATPMTLSYLAPSEKNQSATIQLESRSRRGIATASLTLQTPGGYRIHARDPYGATWDGVSCESPYGPWHLVRTTNSPVELNYHGEFDALASPDGPGTATGADSWVDDDGISFWSTYEGTATLSSDGTTYTLLIDMTAYFHESDQVDPNEVGIGSKGAYLPLESAGEECG
jgi:hypothetical protein